MNPQEVNQGYFRFLRARQQFVTKQAAQEGIEGLVLWGAAVDALSRIHAGRTGESSSRNRQCFVRALLELVPGHKLERTAVPLLHHDLSLELPAASDHAVFTSYRAAAGASRIWNPAEDARLAARMPELLSSFPQVEKSVRRNTYAEILYGEYRCCAVHGLELGRKTCRPFEPKSEPHYMNYIYGADDRRLPKHRYRTRIVFPLSYLADVLAQMITTEEGACISVGWLIPDYPTLSD